MYVVSVNEHHRTANSQIGLVFWQADLYKRVKERL